eukprot:TRINITY_DN3819_c0_g2_i3.p1 TRINITY_DN3819_c0_g2~~TRINITY_DN3819_c0_g2_i3.p1  ORF type:complete len:250 (-),score=29.82 TRINITY_DN3819_c0_g2_i3:226-975(-)
MTTVVTRRQRPRSSRVVRYIERDVDTDVTKRAEWELGKKPYADILSMANSYERAAEELSATAADHAHARALTDLAATEKVLRTNAALRDTIETSSDRLAYNYVADTDLPTSLSGMDRQRFGLDYDAPISIVRSRRPRSAEAGGKCLRVVSGTDRALEIERDRALQIASDRERLWQNHRDEFDVMSVGKYDEVLDVIPSRAAVISSLLPRGGRCVLDNYQPDVVTLISSARPVTYLREPVYEYRIRDVVC